MLDKLYVEETSKLSDDEIKGRDILVAGSLDVSVEEVDELVFGSDIHQRYLEETAEHAANEKLTEGGHGEDENNEHGT